MQHKIWIGYDRPTLEDEARRRQMVCTSLTGWGISVVRDTVEAYEMYSGKDSVLLIDTISFNNRVFSALLKPLENPSMWGEIWFYGKSLSAYPFTIRSRCATVRPEHDYMRGSLKHQIEKYTDVEFDTIAADVSRLAVYGMKTAVEMALNKSDFVEMLNCLDLSENFSVFMSHIEKVTPVYVYLLAEWLDGSAIFTATQLMRCPWISDMKLYVDERQSLKDIQAVFIQLFAQKMVL